MKVSSLLYCSILFWSVAYGAAEPECDLTIRDGNAAQDLDRVLRCFDQRLKVIEATIPESGKHSEDKVVAASNQSANSNTAIREGIAFTAKQISKNGDDIAVVIGIVNTNKYPIGAMLIQPWPSLVDDGGGDLEYKGVGGFIVCMHNQLEDFDFCSSNKNDWQYYKLLEPNNKVTAVFKFASSSKTSSDADQKMAFAANFMVRKKDQDKDAKPTPLNADIEIDLPFKK